MQHSTYLESKVLTASPQRLHLMLIEGAIRFGRQAEESLRKGERAAAATPLLHMIDIVGELLAAVARIRVTSTKRSPTNIGSCFAAYRRRKSIPMRRHLLKLTAGLRTANVATAVREVQRRHPNRPNRAPSQSTRSQPRKRGQVGLLSGSVAIAVAQWAIASVPGIMR